ncbi:MAG: PLP-dependent aminotransferase family protein [Gemmatimonadales bacterium]
MTIWSPAIASDADPKYIALVDALASDIESGVLTPGDRLPTHRQLADHLGVALGTVSRAYATAERRGLVSGEVGRGTFVRGVEESAEQGGAEDGDSALVDLTRSRLARARGDQTLGNALENLSRRTDLARLLDFYQPAAGMSRHRSAGAAWVRRAGVEADPGRVIVTSGAQHGTATVLASLTRPGDVVLTEQLTYTGMKAIASLLHIQLHPLPLDADGLLPEAFAEACRTVAPRALYCMPTLHNPTGRTMPLERRREIARIAEEHDVPLVEDDVYGFLPGVPVPPLAALAPSLSYYITSTSKSLAPGLRIGYVVAPEGKVERVTSIIRASTWLTAPLLAEVATAWIEGGEADDMVLWKRRETGERHALARRLLAPWFTERSELGFHFWLPLPQPWRTEEFVAQARGRGVVVSPSEEFVVGRESSPHAVRVCLGAGISRERLEGGLLVLAELLREDPEPNLTTY